MAFSRDSAASASDGKGALASGQLPRRRFLQAVASGTAALPLWLRGTERAEPEWQLWDDFSGPDSWYHGDQWESLNPGYWSIEGQQLRRRINNFGDRARRTGFPYHYETHGQNGGVMSVDYDPSLPHGALYRRDWHLEAPYALEMEMTVHGREGKQRPDDSSSWRQYQDGYAFAGFAFGASNLFDSFGVSDGAWLAVWHDDGSLSIREGRGGNRQRRVHQGTESIDLKTGDRATLQLMVLPIEDGLVELRFQVRSGNREATLVVPRVPRDQVSGYVGLTGRGLMDFSVHSFRADPVANRPREVRLNECLTCYALGPTLAEGTEGWSARFIGLFRNPGDEVVIRVADTPNPSGGWQQVPVAGRAKVVSNAFRRNTAVIDARLPRNPSEAELYYTVWKDGVDVTADDRVGTAACGPGTAFLGDVPVSGQYVGRLPRLQAPYRLCGLSCHAIHSGRAALPEAGRGQANFFRDQPTFQSYRHLDEYQFQVMLWEDDVWYLELMLYPPSTDDAYKVIANTIAGPTSRWQMMRHWNVINPGDHDYGMDDVKGPEQLAIRWHDGLGQDRDYLRRNFQIVQHLISGDETVSPTANPKKWRRWKMPDRDFSLLVLDSRLWRSSQDTKMWDDEGWGHMNTLYDRADPTRSLLGEEQFAWLQEIIRTDASQMICLTGLNGLHTVWKGRNYGDPPFPNFEQRDRVAADYAGWVKAGVDRVLELLGSRNGVVSVYGDVHNGCLMKNLDHRLYECSFGPIGRSGGRSVIDGFGPQMKDYDGRPLEVKALYHSQHGSPDLKPRQGPYYWNFLEMVFDTQQAESRFDFRLRNLIDPPTEPPRGGGAVSESALQTGRLPSSELPALELIPRADVLITHLSGRPIQGARTDETGRVLAGGLVGVPPQTRILVIARQGVEAVARVVTTNPIPA